MAQRLVRLQFDFNCSFVFMISVYFDVNSFKLFLYVSAYFCLLIGGGGVGGEGGGVLRLIKMLGDSNTGGY